MKMVRHEGIKDGVVTILKDKSDLSILQERGLVSYPGCFRSEALARALACILPN
jgi:hypothetical protein